MRFITKTDEVLYILIRILSSWNFSIIYLYKNESYKDLVTMGLSLYETNRVEIWYDETKFSKSENLLLKSGGIVSKGDIVGDIAGCLPHHNQNIIQFNYGIQYHFWD